MRRALDDSMLATGPLAAALAAGVHPLAGIAAAVTLVALVARSAVRGRRTQPPVITVVPLQPRRPAPRPAISVATITQAGPGVRALSAGELPSAHLRRAPERLRSVDAPLV